MEEGREGRREGGRREVRETGKQGCEEKEGEGGNVKNYRRRGIKRRERGEEREGVRK